MPHESSLATVVLATRNPGKLAEFERLLAGAGWTLLPMPADLPPAPEDGDTYAANAEAKARAAALASGLPALADDSGIEVDALGGAPGVRSARYAGEGASDADNVDLLLDELRRVGAGQPDQRRARFRAVVIAVFPDGSEIVGEGAVEGTIVAAPRGAGGFGYDPVFAPDGLGGRTFAEVDPADKHRLSHRGRALRALLVGLRSQAAGVGGP